MIAQGKHPANVTGASFGTSSNGNEQIAIQFEITGEGQDAGSTIAYLGTFTDAAFEYTEKALRACGWEGSDLSEVPDLAASGKLGPCEIVVQHEEYEGKQRAKIRFVNKPGGGRFAFKPGTELAGNDLRSFAARMKSAFSTGGSRPQSTRPRRENPRNGRPAGYGASDPHPNAPGSDRGGAAPDDDIPF